jgi:indole-3-glycerol phosphate synthase
VDWKSLHAAKQAEIQRLTRVRVSEVTPSIRNFAQYVTTHKQDLAFIAALKRVDPQTGRSWNDRDLVALAQECDDAELAAIAVYTEPSVFGTSLDDLQAVSAAVSAPVLRLDLLVHPAQIYQARLCGADAVLLCAGAVDTAALTNLLTVASSAHVTPVVAVQSEAEVEQALAAGAFILAIASPSGRLDLAQCRTLAAAIPPQKTIIALDEISTPGEYATLQGKVDAALVGNIVLDAPDVSLALAGLTGR